jgi:hypothetical protein
LNCKQVREWMNLWIDGVLEKQEQEIFNKHIMECKECRKELDEYTRMISLVQNMEEEELPDGFHERLHQKLVEESKMARRSMRSMISSNRPIKLIKWIGAIAAVFVLLFSLGVLDNINFGYKAETRNDMQMQSAESSGESANLDMASIYSESEEQEYKQQETESYNIAEAQGDSSVQMKFAEDAATQDTMRQDNTENDVGRIKTDFVKVKVQDVCITPFTIKMMAVNNGIDVIKSSEDSVILKLNNPEHREILYRELSRLGEVEEAGDDTESMQVTIVIVREE